MNDLDRVLAQDDTLVPSSGFSRRVMDAVTVAAIEPRPLPFPWTRFLGLVLVCAAWTASSAWLASTTTASILRSALAGLEPIAPQVQDFGLLAAIALVATLAMVRWRPGTAPTP